MKAAQWIVSGIFVLLVMLVTMALAFLGVLLLAAPVALFVWLALDVSAPEFSVTYWQVLFGLYLGHTARWLVLNGLTTAGEVVAEMQKHFSQVAGKR